MTEPAPAEQRAPETGAPGVATPFADLDERPVAEHVAVFEDEHTRLRQELSSIDQL